MPQFFIGTAVLVVMLCLATVANAAACTQSDDLTCIGESGMSIANIMCLSNDPSTCNVAMCDADGWRKYFACINARCQQEYNQASCLVTYQVCDAAFKAEFCPTPAPPDAPVTPVPPTPAPPTLSPSNTGVAPSKVQSSRPASLTFGSTGNMENFVYCDQAAAIEMAFQQINSEGGIRGTQLHLDIRHATDLIGVAAFNAAWDQVATANVFGHAIPSFESSPFVLERISRPYNIPLVGAPGFDSETLFGSDSRPAINGRYGTEQEFYAMIQFGIHGPPKCTRFAIIYADILLIKDFHDRAARILEDMGYPYRSVGTAYPMPDSNATTYEKFSSLYNDTFTPNCYMIFSDTFIVPIYWSLLSRHHRFDPDSYLLLTSLSIDSQKPMVDSFTKTITPVFQDRIFTSVLTPDPDHPTSRAAASYRAAFAAYNWRSEFSTAQCSKTKHNFAQFSNYITGRLIGEILAATPSPVTRDAFIDTVYEKKVFTVDDIVLGPFNDKCTDTVTADSVPCFCNIGSRKLFVAKYGAQGFVTGRQPQYQDGEFGTETLHIPMSKCRMTEARDHLSQSHRFGLLIDDAKATDANVVAMKQSVTNMMIGHNKEYSKRAVLHRSYAMPVRYTATTTTAIKRAVDRYDLMSYIGGTASTSTIAAAGANVLRIVAEPDSANALPVTPAAFDNQTIFLVPELQDYVHTLASYAITKLGAPVHVAASSSAESSYATKSLNTFGASPASSSNDATTAVQESRVVLVVSQDAEFVQAAIKAAGSTSSATVLIATAEEVLESLLSGVPKNVLFASMFTAFWQPNNALGKQFNAYDAAGREAVPTQAARSSATVPSVSSLRSAFAFLAAATAAESVTANTAAAFREWWFRPGTKSVSGVPVGPFSMTACGKDGSVQCECGKAPQQFSVHQLHEWANASSNAPERGVYQYANEGCHVVYRPLPSNSLSSAVIAAIAIGAVLGVAIIAFGAVTATRGRDNAAAPKDESKPFAIVFTDIQSSTTLWAQDPEAMSIGVEMHHIEMRKLIKQHGGYEVKTIGDSFMVAFKKPHAAAAFALEIQDVFFKIQWPSTAFDDIYEMKLREDLEITEMNEKNQQKLDPFVSTELWNGIRVRVGVHYGIGSIQKDEVTQGYDYYGTVVNTAARVEGVGHGGQVLLTDAAYNAVFGPDATSKPKDVVCIDLGLQPLRGLSESVKLYQCSPQHLNRRKFPALRLDSEAADDKESDLESLAETRSSGGSVYQEGIEGTIAKLLRKNWKDPASQSAASARLHDGVAFVQGMLATSTTDYRADFTKHIAEKWHVDMPRVHDDKRRRVLEEIALAQVMTKVLKALEAKEQRDGGHKDLDQMELISPVDGTLKPLSPNSSGIHSPKHQ